MGIGNPVFTGTPKMGNPSPSQKNRCGRMGFVKVRALFCEKQELFESNKKVNIITGK